MAVSSILIAVQAFYQDGRPVSQVDFIDPLLLDVSDPVERIQVEGGRWVAGLVYFPLCRVSEFKGMNEPSEMLLSKLRDIQSRAANFLDARSTSIFDRMRELGMEIRIFIDVRMDQDQMDIPLEARFVAACGRYQLPIFVTTNDISAAEALSAQANK